MYILLNKRRLWLGAWTLLIWNFAASLIGESSFSCLLTELIFKLRIKVLAVVVDSRFDNVASSGVLHLNCENPITIDKVSDGNLHLASRSRCDATNDNFGDLCVIFCSFFFTLKHSYSKFWLVIFVRRKIMLCTNRKSWVARDKDFVSLLVSSACEDLAQKALLFDCVRNLQAERLWRGII